jgi:hypothetical protein
MAVPDLRIEASLSDVRNKDLSDYSGNVLARGSIRVTDNSNGPAGGPYNDQATTTDQPFPIPIRIPCTATSTGDIGSSCNLLTSASAVAAGTVVGGKRAAWELGQFEVWDGGSDGSVDTTADNTLFAKQGVFIP